MCPERTPGRWPRALLLTLLLLTAVAASFGQRDLYEGSDCTVQGVSGVCRKLSECPRAVNDLKRQKRPQHCSFIRFQPIVCCVGLEDEPSPGPSQPFVTSLGTKTEDGPSTAPPSSRPRAGTIAKRKCQDYTRYVYKTEPTFVLSWLTTSENKTQCANPGDALVTGGKEAKTKEFPHMAMVGRYSSATDQVEYTCGGSLISPLYVLTAAHCTTDDKRAEWVLLGEILRPVVDVKPTNEPIKVSGITLHPDYFGLEKYFDIALLRLEKEPPLSGLVRPACLHTEFHIPLETAPIATGWGLTDTQGERSDQLMKVRLPVQDYSLCNASFTGVDRLALPRGILDDTQLCAGDTVGIKDTCPGDSGGPLQLFSSDKPLYCMHHIVGVTSFGQQCGIGGNPAIYSRVSSFVSWIEGIVWPEPDSP